MDAPLGAVRGGLDCFIVADGLGFLGYIVLVDATAPRLRLGEFFRHAVDCSGGLREREKESGIAMRLLPVAQREQSKVAVQAPVECRVHKVGSRERENKVGVGGPCGDGGGGGCNRGRRNLADAKSFTCRDLRCCCVTVFVVAASRRARAFM